MTHANVLAAAADHAARYLEQLPSRPIAGTASLAELRRRLGKPLPEAGLDATTVIDELVRDTEGGLMASTSGRFFGWVIGGTLPAAIAADWLTSTWDQNAASNLTAPAEAVIEDVCGEWMKELLDLPKASSFAFLTGCQMAHTTALAAAHHKLLRDRGWDVEAAGLAGAPPLTILTTENRHESILRSARLLGVGTNAIRYVGTDNMGRLRPASLADELQQLGGAPAVVWLQAGDLNTGVFDPFAEHCGACFQRMGACRRGVRSVGRDQRGAPASARGRRACRFLGDRWPQVAAPVINQGLVRFLGADGNHDRATDEVIRAIQQKGVAWFGGATWNGRRVMRISVCNWATTDGDIDQTVASVAEVLSERR